MRLSKRVAVSVVAGTGLVLGGVDLNMIKDIAEVDGWHATLTKSESGATAFEFTGVGVVE